LILVAVALASALTATAAAAPKPLFESEAILALRIEAPFAALIKGAPRSKDSFDAKLLVLGAQPESLAIELSARGISRRNPNVCEFPPLRIVFKDKPGESSLFRGQHALKLATHCRADADSRRLNPLEFAAYRMLSVVTPVSFRVRMAEVDYVEARSGALRIHRSGFLIEDVHELAARNGLKEVKTLRTELDQFDPTAVARSELLEYMVGNLDWSDRAGPAGTECCHNVKILGASREDTKNFVPVPYDFDATGFVDPPYALPPIGIPVKTVRTRYYRGYCRFNAQATEVARSIFEKRADVLASIRATPFLSDGDKTNATRYMETFFDEIKTPEDMSRRILNHCRP
jgi:hypothetical protein